MTFEVLILAAGQSSRFGAPKQLAVFEGKSLLQRAIELSLAAGKEPIVTLGAHAEQITQDRSVGSLLERQATALQVPDWSEGMSRSICAGVEKAIQRNAGGILMLLVDQPLITAADLKRMSHEIDPGEPQIIASSYQGTAGVPAYFSWHYFPALMALKGDVGARKLIQSNPHQLIEMDGRLLDIDTQVQLESLASR